MGLPVSRGVVGAKCPVRVELPAALTEGCVTCTSERGLFKSPWAKAVIGPRAWAGLGQLLEREERPQLLEREERPQRRTGARIRQGSRTVTSQAQCRERLGTNNSSSH